MNSKNDYTIHIASKAQKDLKKLDLPVRKKIIQAVHSLQSNRHPQQFKPIVGKSIAQFRLRIGDYRILYDIYDQSQIVLILRIGHRKNIYK